MPKPVSAPERFQREDSQTERPFTAALNKLRTSPVRLFLGISVFWIAIGMLFDGLNSLVLPSLLLVIVDKSTRATTLGLTTFVGVVVGMLFQPVAGMLSDRLHPRWGRIGTLGVGVLLTLISIAFMGLASNLTLILVGYLMVQVTGNLAQAAQQGFIPDLVQPSQRGAASGVRGFMHVGGSLLGFIVLGYFLSVGEVLAAFASKGLVVGATFLLTLGLVHENRGKKSQTSVRFNPLDVFRLDLKRYRSFTWVVVSRFLFLLGTYAVGRFLVFLVADKLALSSSQAARVGGAILATLTLVTLVSSPFGGWAADRIGRRPLLVMGALSSALGAGLIIIATSSWQILLAGSIMSVGSAAFIGANWALIADLVPPNEASRFFGLANFGTAGAIAAAGLFGPVIDWANRLSQGSGYVVLLGGSALAIVASILPLYIRQQPSPLVQ